MRGQGLPAAPGLEAKVRAASPHRGPWPTLSVWQGSADHTVNPANAEAILAQWCALHALRGAPEVETAGRHSRRAWRDAAGRELVEAWTIADMGHGTPIDAGPDGCGTPGPFMLDVGISSTRHIAHRWGLAPAPATVADRPVAATPGTGASVEAVGSEPPGIGRPHRPGAAPTPAASRVGQVIEDALRAAGLMR